MDSDTAQLLDAIRSSPPGTYKLFRATDSQPAIEQALNNREELYARIQHAKAVKCFIEVVSLRLQYLEIWLSAFFENTPHHRPRRREFGWLLDQCLKQGLEKNLYSRIKKFNDDRVKSIHLYLSGATTYAEIEGTALASEGLSELLAEFVLLNSGKVIITAADFEKGSHKPGDTIYNVAGAVAALRLRNPV